MSQGLLEGPVGRRRELEFVIDRCRREWPKREGQVSVGVLLAAGSRSRAFGGVVHGSSEFLQAMGLNSEAVLADVAVGEVTNGFIVEKVGGDWTHPMVEDMGMAMS